MSHFVTMTFKSYDLQVVVNTTIRITNPTFDAHFWSFFVCSTNFQVVMYRAKTVAYVFFAQY